MFLCNYCKNPYALQSSLRRHMVTKHPEKVVPVKKNIKCLECDKTFNSRSGLIPHEVKIHNKCYEKKTFNKNVKCSECSYKCNTMKDLCCHVGNAHNVEIKKESLDFNSMEEFVAWKAKIELDTKSVFIQHNSSFLQSPTRKLTYFYCNRSGYHKYKGNNIRQLKKQSCKMNAFCCAHIKVKMLNDGKISAEFVRTHTGHNLELDHLRLSLSERDMLAEKIARKIPFQEIIKEIKQTPSSFSNRAHLVTIRDLHNIRSSYGLDTDDPKHKNDESIIKSWMHDMKQSGYKIAYKPQGSIIKEFPVLENQDYFLAIRDESQVEMPQDNVLPSTSACDKSQFDASLENFKEELDSIANFVTNMVEIEVAERIIKTVKPTLEAMRGNASPKNFKIKSNIKEGQIAKQRLYILQKNSVECSKSTLKNPLTQKKESKPCPLSYKS